MKTKNNDTKRKLLLQLLEAVNSQEEFDYLQSELAQLDSPSPRLAGHGISEWVAAYSAQEVTP